MASIKIEKAIVKHVGATVNVSDNYRKRDLIITVDNETEYPQTIKIEAGQAKCEDQNLNEIRPGDEVTVHANLRGREWLNPKNNITEVFNTLAFWKVEINRTSTGNATQQNQSNFAQPAPQVAPSYAPPIVDNNTSADEEDDLPF